MHRHYAARDKWSAKWNAIIIIIILYLSQGQTKEISHRETGRTRLSNPHLLCDLAIAGETPRNERPTHVGLAQRLLTRPLAYVRNPGKRAKCAQTRRFLPERDYVTFGSLLSQIRLSVMSVCRSFVTPSHPVEIFHNVCTPFCTLAIHWPPCKILWRSSQGRVGGWTQEG